MNEKATSPRASTPKSALPGPWGRLADAQVVAMLTIRSGTGPLAAHEAASSRQTGPARHHNRGVQ